MPATVEFKPIAKQVIVITGASSGIGLATAYMAATKGARVVLSSRNEQALDDACRAIQEKGGEATYVVADVSDRLAVENIARIAIQRFGGFDTWVNNAGIGTLGRLDQISEADHKRLFETNFWGLVNGSFVAIDYLRHHGGTLINLGSEVSDAAVPLQGMYSASKHAVKGFTNSLRIELEEEGAPVSVTLIKPSAIATPFFEHAKNYTDREFRAPPPVYAPQEVARAILYAATHPRREIYIGSVGKFMAGMQAHAPRLYDWVNATFMMKAQQGTKNPSHLDNLHAAGDDGRIYGRNENAQDGHRSLYTRASLHPVVTGVAMAGLGLAALMLFKSGTIRKSAFSAAGFAAPFLKDKLVKKAKPHLRSAALPKLLGDHKNKLEEVKPRKLAA